MFRTIIARVLVPIALTVAAFSHGLTTPPRAHAAPSPQPPAFSWPGVYDLIGKNFPEGQREAVATITRVDSGYTLDMYGPPGSLVKLHVVGDSAHLVWDLGPEGLMYGSLHGRGDSLTGRWQILDASGPLVGVRRRRG